MAPHASRTTSVSRSVIPGLTLALVVLVASVAALLLAGDLGDADDTRGAPLRPAATRQPVKLADPTPTPAGRR
jgi:hypothetical protein